MKKIVLGCAAVLLSLGLLAGCNKDDDVDDKINNTGPEENEPTDDGNEGTTDTGPGPEEGGDGDSGTTYPAPTGNEDPAYFGFEVDGVGYYMTGETVSGYDYEGALTTSVDDAVLVSIEKGEEENEFYLSFGEEEAAPASALQPYREGDDGDGGEDDNKTYITIVENEGHTDLSYATEKVPIYWNETYGCWGDASEEYFLCYNATYGCLYCSAIASWIESSPIATLIEPAEVTSITILGPSWVNVGETITLEAVVNLGASNAVTWSIEDEDNHITVDASTGEVTGNTVTETPVTVTATAANEVTASVKIEVVNITLEQTTELVSGGTYYLGSLVDNAYHLVTGKMSGYNLATAVGIGNAAPITVTGSDTDGWTLTLEDGNVIYGYVANNYANFGIGSASDGVSTFDWNTTNNIFTSSKLSYTYTSSSGNSTTYSNVYFEYYNSSVCLYGTNDLSSVFSNVASLYQVVEEGD